MTLSKSSSLTDDLAEIGSEGSLCLLLRHAARQRIESASAEAAFNAALTETGHEEALALGSSLPATRPALIHYSPVPRCHDTATRIAEGLRGQGGEATIVGPRRLLGATFVKDERKVISTFASLGLRGFIRAWFRDELPPTMVENPRTAGEELLDGLAPRLDEPLTRLHVNISHDVVIIALLGLAWSVDEPEFPWPGFLDGVVLRPHPEGAMISYHGERRLLDRPTPRPGQRE